MDATTVAVAGVAAGVLLSVWVNVAACIAGAHAERDRRIRLAVLRSRGVR